MVNDDLFEVSMALVDEYLDDNMFVINKPEYIEIITDSIYDILYEGLSSFWK